MIDGKARIKFGTGDIRIIPGIGSDGVGKIFLSNQESREIGKMEVSPDE